MQQVCPYSATSESGKILCMVDNLNQPCTVQKYCRKDNTWKLTDGFATCQRKEKEMSKKVDNEIDIPTVSEIVEVQQEEKEKQYGEVILVCETYIVVQNTDGNATTLYNYPEVKLGEIIEY